MSDKKKWPELDAEAVSLALHVCGNSSACSGCPLDGTGEGCSQELKRQAGRVIRDLRNATTDVADREIGHLRQLAVRMNGPEGQLSHQANEECFRGINEAISRLGRLQRGSRVLMTPVNDLWVVEYITVSGVEVYRKEAADG